MLKLFATGWLAHGYGKRRGVVYLTAGVAPLAVAHFLGTIVKILPDSAQLADAALHWLQGSLSGVAVLLAIYGCHRLYRDYERHGYVEDAGHYRRRGSYALPSLVGGRATVI